MHSLSFRNLIVMHLVIFLVIFSYIPNQVLAAQGKKLGPLEKAEYTKKYNFSVDYFTSRIPLWEKILYEFKGKPNIHYLEIGVFEGRSLIWMLENILTHPTSRATCIDTFPENMKKIFYANLKASGFFKKVTTIKGRSQIELRHLPLNSFDIIYIDGSHTADDVLADAILSWELLKSGGLLIFDDYLLYLELPIELRPNFAIEAFMLTYKNHIDEVVHLGDQVILRKNKIPRSQIATVPFGQYIYVFGLKILYRSRSKEQKLIELSPELIELSDKEKEIIEKAINSKGMYQYKFPSDSKIFEDEDFIKLRNKLKLELLYLEDNKTTR